MATVAQLPELMTRIEHALDCLSSEWSAIPEVAAEWDDWDEYSRFDPVLEWPIREDQLHLLQGWRARELLTALQLERFLHLEELIDRSRPLLERLLED